MWLIIVNGYMHCKFIMIVTVVIYYWAFLRAQLAKNQPAMQKTPFQFLGQEDPLEKEMATHSSENSMDRGAWKATVQGVARVVHDLATKPPPYVK